MRDAAQRWLALITCLGSIGCVEDERFLGSVAGGGSPAAPAFGPFSTPRQIAELSDSERDQYDPALSADKLTIFYRSEPRRAGGSGRSEIMMAERSSIADVWGEPRVVTELDAPEAWNLSPDLTLDGLALWFSSDRDGTMGGLDLWLATRSSVLDPWSIVENVEGLNTPDWDTDCGISADQLDLVFSRFSAGRDANLFLARRGQPEGAFTSLTELAELNSPGDDWDAAFALDGLLLMFASTANTRPELAGMLHIYEAQRPSRSEPFGPPVFLDELAVPGAIDEDPWLSNDGRHVVFASTRDGRRHLYEAIR